jgi:hypothetical protein
VVEHGNDRSLIVRDAAYNKTKSFFNANGLMVEKIDQENDIGIDAILTLARSGADAGLNVNLQIKGGRKYKRKLHIDERFRRIGYVSHRQVDWQLSADVTPPRGFEGHHVVDMDSRLRIVWRNSRPIYAIVHDPDDEELYFGNLARMADVEPLDQDLASAYVPDGTSQGNKRLTRAYKRISGLSEVKLRDHKTWIPLYPDLRLTPDGLERFLKAARAEARQPIPDRSPYDGGEVPIYVTYPDGTVGLSREALDTRDRFGLDD